MTIAVVWQVDSCIILADLCLFLAISWLIASVFGEELASRGPQVNFSCMWGLRGAPSTVEEHGSSDLFGSKTSDLQEESFEKVKLFHCHLLIICWFF